jgi:hypothetical protein
MSNYLTHEDVQNYGSELVAFSQRAALNAAAPHLQNLEQQNLELQRRLAIEARRNLDQRVEAAVPDFREIDRDPDWHRYLLGVETYSGRVRQVLLNDAIAAGDASRVIQFFRGFRREEQNSGQPHGHASASAQHRQRRAGASQASSGGPIYDNASIKQMYENRRKGMYDDATWARLESDLAAAFKENRVASKLFLSK